MKYLAVTQETAKWIFVYSDLISSIHQSLTLIDQIAALKTAEVVAGPLRLSGTQDGRLVALWNVDYLSGTGEEDWGFIKLDEDMGLASMPTISREVLERCLYVVDLRLRGLIIDSTYIHHAYENGTHTCLAGRGEEARQYSIGYLESDLRLENSSLKAVACVGPSRDYKQLTNAAAKQRQFLGALVKDANRLIAPHRKRPLLDENAFTPLRNALGRTFGTSPSQNVGVTFPTEALAYDPQDVYRTLGWDYEEWAKTNSPLSPTQRRILESDAVLRHPLRIVGPGGSGKSLLMQLLAMRRLKAAKIAGQAVRVLYVVHNAAMARNMDQRFEVLGAEQFVGQDAAQELRVCTLSEYGRKEIELQEAAVIDVDAHQTKLFQLEQVREALRRALEKNITIIQQSTLLSQVARDPSVFEVFSRLVMAEISTAIKGHGFVHDQQKYVSSERHLSRLHGLMTQQERTMVFQVFLEYHKVVFEEYQVLDSDDIALSLLGRLRTPIWELKRKTLGYDFVFVDETQLFNENERRLFPLLSRGGGNYVPIVLALDEAQEIYGQTSAGLGALGIKAISNENLPSNHRSTKSIVQLAFFIIQRTTDLFGADFPDFTGVANAMEADNHPFAAPPSLEVCGTEARGLGRFVVKRIRELRKQNIRQIAVICHTDLYWDEVLKELKEADNIEPQILLQRGDRLSPDQPLVVITRPAYVGGQEFDAVIAVGLEQGVVPPRIVENQALAAAVEQQALREMYLSFTRARYRLMVVTSAGAAPSSIIQEARRNGLIT